jgi:hypothetical protein
MQELFSTPEAITAFVVILTMQSFSLLLLFLNIQIFRSQTEKYRLLLANFGNQSAWGTPGRFLVPIYIVITLSVTVASSLIFLFQPHLL